MVYLQQLIGFCRAEPYWAAALFLCGYIIGVLYLQLEDKKWIGLNQKVGR